jgi:hypothetical protein
MFTLFLPESVNYLENLYMQTDNLRFLAGHQSHENPNHYRPQLFISRRAPEEAIDGLCLHLDGVCDSGLHSH